MSWFGEYVIRPACAIVGAIVSVTILVPLSDRFAMMHEEGVIAGGLVTAIGAVVGLKLYRVAESMVLQSRNK